MHFKDLNHHVSSAGNMDIIIENTLGQRYVDTRASGNNIEVHGVP